MKTITYLFIIIILISFFSCGTDPSPTSADTEYKLEVPSHFPPPIIPADNPLTVNKIKLGRMLFYDPILSLDSTISCAACHKQRFAFGDSTPLNKKINHGSTNRNSSVLFNLAFTNSFFWDGRTNTLEATCLDAAIDEMAFDLNIVKPKLLKNETYNNLFKTVYGTENITSDHVIKALASFIRTLISAGSKLDRGAKEGNPNKYLNAQELAGKSIFTTEQGDCFHCHGDVNGNPLFTDNKFRNNGLTNAVTIADFPDKGLGGFNGNPLDIGKFKTASLRNLSFTAPYMHAGQLRTLDDVIEHYSTRVANSEFTDNLMKFKAQGGVQLSLIQRNELKAFLLTLDDPDFIKNPNHSNPFK